MQICPRIDANQEGGGEAIMPVCQHNLKGCVFSSPTVSPRGDVRAARGPMGREGQPTIEYVALQFTWIKTAGMSRCMQGSTAHSNPERPAGDSRVPPWVSLTSAQRWPLPSAANFCPCEVPESRNVGRQRFELQSEEHQQGQRRKFAQTVCPTVSKVGLCG